MAKKPAPTAIVAKRRRPIAEYTFLMAGTQ
jgi:hypothetical protein